MVDFCSFRGASFRVSVRVPYLGRNLFERPLIKTAHPSRTPTATYQSLNRKNVAMSSPLTSRERVRRALNHQPTDRVPVDFGGSRVTGIAAIAYKRLLNHLNQEEEIRLYDIKQQLALPSAKMIERLGGDVVQLHRLAPSTGLSFLALDQWQKGEMTDASPCWVPAGYSPRRQADGTLEIWHEGVLYAQRPPSALYFDICAAPLAHAETLADIDRFVWPDPWSQREEEWLKAQVHQLYHQGDKAIFAGLPLMVGSFFEIGAVLFGYERFLENLILNPQLIEHWLESKLNHDLAILEKFLAVAGEFIDVIQLNDDFGAQTALQISPKMYREIFKPRQKRWIEFVKARTRAKIFIHCDGAIREILPDFIEIGIDVLNPLQSSATGMDPEIIKREFGKDLSFWGAGIETQSTLHFGSIAEIRQEVKTRLQQLRHDGGFVFGTVHNIQPDISPEKILAVFDTVAEFGAC